ncbi:MAG: sigma-70 family RNA polymerase sigma factor [Clostridia bacterium]|nr:sigma-70 family RNA polymerase sigma factor [Clostridia bacterium]
MSQERMEAYNDAAENEALLVAAQGAGESAAEAEAELVRRYLPLVRSLSRPLYLWGWESEDFIQEGTLGLIKAIRSYRSERETPFGAYAKVCVLHELNRALQSNLRKKDIPREGVMPLESVDEWVEATGSLGVEEAVISKVEVTHLVEEIQKALSPLEKKVLSAYLEGLSFDEMAEAISVPKKAVNNAMYRIRAKSEKVRAKLNQA